MDARPILCKLLHPLPALDWPVDAAFQSIFNPAVHESQLRAELDLSHLPVEIQDQVYSLIQEFWSVFDGKGYSVPVKTYKCIIDTGSARPIAVKKILYGDNKIPIMRHALPNWQRLVIYDRFTMAIGYLKPC
jgi:predicted phosphoadenosine phosphosulfate sulfurtransferase